MIEFRLFGYPTVWRDGEQVTGFVSEKALALALFVADSAETHARDYLTGLFWGDSAEANAKASLRTALHNLSKLLPGLLEVTRKTVSLSAEVWLDTHQLRHHGDPTVYRDDFLAGFYISGAPEFELWQLRQREQLRSLAVDAWQTHARHAQAARRQKEALAAWQALVQLEPWHENAHFQLMQLHARGGRFEAALHQFAACQAQLEAELGVAPRSETQQLADRIRVARSLPRTNLPAETTPILGRDTLLSHIDRQLQTQRLVVLTGLGGMGKTRLAMASGRQQLDHFLHGVATVSLAGVVAGDDARGALADAIVRTLTSVGMLAHSQNSAESHLLSQLAPREMLLILDNLDPLLDGVLLLDDLLRAAPHLRLLATSREWLQLTQEQVVAVDGLSPDDSMALFCERARRVQPDFEPDDSVARLCAQVGGMPLAIELAAGWMDVQRPAELAQSLRASLAPLSSDARNLAQRHRSVSMLFDGVWARLTPSMQHILARLTVFHGTISAEAARHVAAATPADLKWLARRSLVSAEGQGVVVHPLLRQFAKAHVADPDALQRAHATFVLDTFSAEIDALTGGDQLGALERLDGWEDDLLAAWQWAIDAQAWPLLDDLLLPCFLLFEMQTRYQAGLSLFERLTDALEGADEARFGRALAYRVWLEMSLERAPMASAECAVALTQTSPPRTRAQALLGYAACLNDAFDFERTYVTAKEGLASAEIAGDVRLMVRGLILMANCTIPDRLNRPEEGAHLYERGVTIARAAGDLRGLSICLHNFGWYRFYLGKYAAAEAILREVAELHDRLRQPVSRIMSQMMLARALALQGDVVSAEQMACRGLVDARRQQAEVPVLQLLTVIATEIYPAMARDEERAKLVGFLLAYPGLTSHLRHHLETQGDASAAVLTGWGLDDAIQAVLISAEMDHAS